MKLVLLAVVEFPIQQNFLYGRLLISSLSMGVQVDDGIISC